MLSSLAILFLSAFVAATILPASSELVLAAVIVADPDLLWPAVALASLGNTAGAVVNWFLGRFMAHFVDRRWFPLTPDLHRRACGWFRRFGTWSLLFAWLPLVGDPLTVVAGTLRVSFPLFLALVAIGKTARYLAIAIAVQGW